MVADEGATGEAPADERPADGGDSGEAYRGLPGAVVYAYRRSDSRLFRTYAVAGSLLAVAIAVLFGTSLVLAIAETVGTAGGTFTFVRSFVLFVGLLAVGPVLAPPILVARRHRRGASSVRYDRALAAGGYAFALSLYLALVISAPPALREEPPAAIAPVVEALYSLPRPAAVVPPLAAVGLLYLLHRRFR